jgi:hypothetical protein
MTIHIPISDLEPNIRTLYLENNIFELSLDYQTNAITGYFKNKGIYEEVELFNFSKVCKMDNRFTSYKIHKNKTEIILEIVGL